MRLNVSSGGRGVKWRSVCWTCCWSWWSPASQCLPPEYLIRIGVIHPPVYLSVHPLTSPFLFSCVSLCRQFSHFSDRGSLSRPNNLDARRREFIKKKLVRSLSPVFPLLSPLSLSIFLSDCLQILVARQAVRARRRITRRTAKQRLIEVRKLLKKIRLLAKEVRGHIEVTTVVLYVCLRLDLISPSKPSLSSPRVPSQMCFYGYWVEASDWLTSESLPTPSSFRWWRSTRDGTVDESQPSTWR